MSDLISEVVGRVTKTADPRDNWPKTPEDIKHLNRWSINAERKLKEVERALETISRHLHSGNIEAAQRVVEEALRRL